jgi:hypothetical protein
MRLRAEQALVDPVRPVILANLILLALTVVTIGRCFPAVLAAERSQARERTLRTADTTSTTPFAPARGGGSALPASCPYDFGGETPASTFCVYQGAAFGRGGEVCASDAVVVWSSARGPLRMTVQADKGGIPARQVHIAFVDASEIVLQAVVGASQTDRAELVGYTTGDEQVAQPLSGTVTLRPRQPGASRAVDVLEMEVKGPRPFRPGNCALASYSGEFVGVIRSTHETENMPRTSSDAARGSTRPMQIHSREPFEARGAHG